MTRLLLCFALGGVLVNGTVWYKLTLDGPKRPAVRERGEARRGPPSGMPGGEGPPPGMARGFPPDGPPFGFPEGGPPHESRSPAGAGRAPSSGMPPHYRPMMVQQARELIHALERENDPRKAEALAGKHGLDVRRESGATVWSTSETLSPWSDLQGQAEAFHEGGNFEVGSSFVSLREGDVRWIVYFPSDWKPGLLSDLRFRWLLVGQFSFVVFFCLVFGLWQLKPLRSLQRGVREIARGNFDHRVPVEQESELGDLARTFNHMSAEVKTLMEAKDELLAGISHDLRSPLARMRLAIHVEQAESLPRIERDILNMDRLIGEILESSRWRSREPQLRLGSFALAELFAELADQYSARPPGIRIEGVPPDSIVHADRDRLARVLVNLVENALKYSGTAGGPVRLAAREVEGGIEITVRDRGPGVPEESIGRLFEVYYRVDPSKPGGYGLGLSLCKKIVEAHGGTIRASNLASGGLEVALILPRRGQAKAA